MRWLSKIIKFSSWNIRFSTETEQEIDKVAEQLSQYYLDLRKDRKIYTIKALNLYTSQKETIYIIVLSESVNKKAIAVYNPAIVADGTTCNVYPYNLPPKIKNKSKIYDAFKNALQHEMAHAFDPKLRMPGNMPQNDFEYYSSPVEFDGYSKQIIENLRMQLPKDPYLYNDIIKWIKYPININNLPNVLNNYYEIFLSWMQSDNQNKTKYIRTFKHRLYNEIFSGDENNDRTQ